MWNHWFHLLFNSPVESGFLSWCFVGRGEDRTEAPAPIIDTSGSGKGQGMRSNDKVCAQAAVSK